MEGGLLNRVSENRAKMKELEELEAKRLQEAADEILATRIHNEVNARSYPSESASLR